MFLRGGLGATSARLTSRLQNEWDQAARQVIVPTIVAVPVAPPQALVLTDDAPALISSQPVTPGKDPHFAIQTPLKEFGSPQSETVYMTPTAPAPISERLPSPGEGPITGGGGDGGTIFTANGSGGGGVEEMPAAEMIPEVSTAPATIPWGLIATLVATAYEVLS